MTNMKVIEKNGTRDDNKSGHYYIVIERINDVTEIYFSHSGIFSTRENAFAYIKSFEKESK